MEAALLPEGLSDKHFLYGKFGENQALLRVRSSKFAFSQWYFVGNGLARSVRTKVLLRIPPCRKPTNGKHHLNIEEKRLQELFHPNLFTNSQKYVIIRAETKICGMELSNMKKNPGKVWLPFAAVAVCLVAVMFCARAVREKNDLLNHADTVFQGCFSELCNNLNETESNEVNVKNEKYAYACFTVFGLTSFSENAQLNQIVHTLYDLSERKALYGQLKEDDIRKLNKLSVNLSDEELLGEVYAGICE